MSENVKTFSSKRPYVFLKMSLCFGQNVKAFFHALSRPFSGAVFVFPAWLLVFVATVSLVVARASREFEFNRGVCDTLFFQHMFQRMLDSVHL